jgi:hypothetical protein
MKYLAPLIVFAAACGGDGGDDDTGGEHAYILGSLVFGPEATTSYVSVLDSLEPQTVDYNKAHEFSGAADVWVHGSSVFVADDETLMITKYSVEGHDLVAHEAIGFSGFGITDFGFWRNVFVSDDKAYFSNGSTQYVVWNPTTMEITGTLALPALDAREGFKAFPGYSDRAALLRDGKLYQPLYWTDDTYFRYTPDSRIAVIDVATDHVVDVIDAPCPGLDFGSADAAGNLYFSSWIYAAGAAAVLDQPATCVFEVPADGSAPRVATTFADIAGGREGAALRFLSGGRAVFSVLHDERFTVDPTTDPSVPTFGPNWRFWSYNPTTQAGAELDAIDWNAGAQYSFDIDGKDYMLVAAGDYGATTIYDLGDPAKPAATFDALGWSTRLFKLH